MAARFRKGQLLRDERRSMRVVSVHRDHTLTVKCRFSLDPDGQEIPGTYLGCCHRYCAAGLEPFEIQAVK